MAGREPGAHSYAVCAPLASDWTHGARGQRQPESRPGLARSVLFPKIDCPDVFHARTGVLISNSQDAAAFCLLEVTQTSNGPRAGFAGEELVAEAGWACLGSVRTDLDKWITIS